LAFVIIGMIIIWLPSPNSSCRRLLSITLVLIGDRNPGDHAKPDPNRPVPPELAESAA